MYFIQHMTVHDIIASSAPPTGIMHLLDMPMWFWDQLASLLTRWEARGLLTTCTATRDTWAHMRFAPTVLVVCSHSSMLHEYHTLTGREVNACSVCPPPLNDYQSWPTGVAIAPRGGVVLEAIAPSGGTVSEGQVHGRGILVCQYQGPSVIMVDRALTTATVHQASRPLVQESPEGIAVCEAPSWLRPHTDTIVLITSVDAQWIPVIPHAAVEHIPCLQIFNKTMDQSLHKIHLLLDYIKRDERDAVVQLMAAQGVPADARLAGIPWGIAVGADHAAYIAMAPEKHLEHGNYTQTSGNKGYILRVPLDTTMEETPQFGVIGCGLLTRPSGLCFDAQGCLYVTGMEEGVARFRPEPTSAKDSGTFFHDGFLCRVQGYPGAGTDDEFVLLAPPMDVKYCDGVFAVSAHKGVIGPEGCAGLYMLNDKGKLLCGVRDVDKLKHPNCLALRRVQG